MTDFSQNIYRHTFYSRCPNDGSTIAYNMTIETTDTIMAEDIVAAGIAADDMDKPYHENIADMMIARFGGKQNISAKHHGVEIETVRERL